MSQRAISIFGSSQPREGEAAYETACELAKELACAGFDIINGGHEGTMAALSAGGRAGGGEVLGVTCSVVRAVRGAQLNRWLSQVIDAPTLFVRIEIMMRRASGYVFLPGGLGTLAELGVVWEHLAKGYISPRPVVMLGEAWRPVIAATEDRDWSRRVHWAGSVAEVVAIMQAEAVEMPAAERDFSAGLELKRAHP